VFSKRLFREDTVMQIDTATVTILFITLLDEKLHQSRYLFY